MYSRNTEIRLLSATDIFKLGQILEQTGSWKKLMRIIPKTATPESFDGPKKYNNDHVRLIADACMKQNRMGMEVLVEEWGTSGRRRPTVGYLLELLVKAELFRAADYVAVDFLNEPIPERPATGPAARVDITLPFEFETEEIQKVEGILDAISYPESTNLIRNANQASNMNNADFYSKLSPDRPKIDISASDLMKFSTASINSRQTTPSSLSNTHNSNIEDSDNSRDGNTAEVSESNIPVLSELQINYNSVELPNLSALNLDVPTTPPMVDDARDYLRTSSMSFDENNLTPDLSILDQSSLDDSSLTNVTDTSGDLSFDSRIRLNLSDNNIPMLSILQK